MVYMKVQKPRPTWRDFMDGKTDKGKAVLMAQAANAIIDLLLPISPKKRAAILTLAGPD